MKSIETILLRPIKDFLFDVSCFHCGNRLQENEDRICSSCWNSLTPVRTDDYTNRVLLDRFREGGVIDEFTALYYFEKGKLLQSLAHSLKYEEVTAFGVELGMKIGERLRGMEIDAIVPAPLNKRKERERGYNQAEFIAKGVSEILRIPVLSRAVRRVKYTVTQTQLNAEQRKENIAEAFDVPKRTDVEHKNILVVDDIITTGSTIQEIGKVLKDAGSRRVIAASAGLAKLGEDS